MDTNKLEEKAGEVLSANGVRADEKGKYHPSEITGCSLRLILDKISDSEDPYNSWLFQGSAVHHYMQETGLLDEILYQAGYHPSTAAYEVGREYEVTEDVTITGTCDVLASNGKDTVILDLKYTSILPSYNHGRLAKYFAQTNTYSYMFNADEYALFLIHNKSRNLPEEGVNVMAGEPNRENWELIQQKAINIHNKLEEMGWEPGDILHTVGEMEEADVGFWEEILKGLDMDHMPVYKEECKHCNFADFCPVKNGDVGSGLRSYIGGKP